MKKSLVIFCILFVVHVQNAPVEDLYLPDDAVEFLNIENFKSHVGNSTTAWLVEFYASWCGHCQRFAPAWKKFASEVTSWQDLVKVAVVECSDEINTPLCREYRITRYPTVKYFHENYRVGSGASMFHQNQNYATVEFLKKALIEKLMEEISQGRGAIYPNLLPYQGADLEQLIEWIPQDVQYVFLVVDAADAYLGAEVALDLHKTNGIIVRHSLKNNSALISKLQIKHFPTVVALDTNRNVQFITSDANRIAVRQTIVKFLEEKGFKTVGFVPEETTNNISQVPPRGIGNAIQRVLRQRIKKMGDVIFQVDLEAAVRYSLRQEVSAVEIIKGNQLEALAAYLQVLKKYFPFGYNSSYFIDELLTLTSNSAEITGLQVEEIVKRAENNGAFSSKLKFLGCEGSSIRYRRYPCSLWRLFHYLTVNSALLKVNNKWTNPRQVLDAMHGYVKYFFGCAHCSRHFQQMSAERNITQVPSLESSILWLWESHNLVNARLKGDPTEDPEYPKKQFPDRIFCPECVDDVGSWKKEEVLQYLKRMYSNANVRYIGTDTDVLFRGLD